MFVKQAHGEAVEAVSGAVRFDVPAEAAFFEQRDGGEQVEGGAVPDGFERLFAVNEFCFVHVTVFAGDQDVVLGVAEVAHIGEQFANRAAVQHLDKRGVGAGFRSVFKVAGIKDELDALLADRGGKIDDVHG